MPVRSSFPRICVALGLPAPQQLLDHARREALAGERFLEMRLDFLPQPESGLPVIRKIVTEFSDCRILATCRRHQNHGRYNGSVEEQLRILSEAIDAGAVAVDVEIESAESAGSRLHVFDGRALLVISYHNFDGTPALDPIVRRITKIPAGLYKVVTTVRKPSDINRVLALPRQNPKTPLVVLGMGETGFPTRVLSGLMGGSYTYAAPSNAEGTATGQICGKQLRQLYRVEKLPRGPKIYGVIADPVRHSISPAIHNRAFQARRIDAIYLPFLVHPLQLKDFFSLAEDLPVAGFSVTIPHKIKILRYLDIVDPLARRIGAVNTVWRRAGKWRGTNTDAEGVKMPLEKRLRLAKASILVAGNGGAARSAAYALAQAGARLAVTGRNPDRVRALARMCDAEPLSREQAEARDFDAVVHATPLGMWPHTDECFFRNRIPGGIIFDMVYTPRETTLLRRAADLGNEIIDGLEMFLAQAATQFRLWTGENPPVPVMERAAVEALGQQSAALGTGS
jgi:3-dehydroquinate dehydratase / shikimate dehydrogenase